MTTTSEAPAPTTPPALRGPDKANFETLKLAAANGDLALLSAVRKSDGKPVALVTAIAYDGSEYAMTPLAVMVEGNPFEDYYDPTA